MSTSNMASRPGRPARPPGPPPGKPPTASTPQNQTIYINNLPDKLNKDDLRRHLYMLFTTYGPVIDIVALKTGKMRGQAHVTFRDTSAASQAMLGCQGMEFFGKKMRIQYSKSKSDKIKKLQGTYHNPASEAAAAAAKETEGMTDLQKAIFGGNAPSTALQPGSGLPPKPRLAPPGLSGATPRVSSTPDPAQGVKRAREEEQEDEDVPMDEDDGSAMEESDDD